MVGKPAEFMLANIAETFGLRRDQICMVGDRLDTDIRFGQDGGLATVLTLSGGALVTVWLPWSLPSQVSAPNSVACCRSDNREGLAGSQQQHPARLLHRQLGRASVDSERCDCLSECCSRDHRVCQSCTAEQVTNYMNLHDQAWKDVGPLCNMNVCLASLASPAFFIRPPVLAMSVHICKLNDHAEFRIQTPS